MKASINYLDNKRNFSELYAKFHHAGTRVMELNTGARAKVRRCGDVLHIGYTGPICLKSMDKLETMVRPCRRGAAASFERFDTAALAWGGPVTLDQAIWPRWTPPSAVIVGHDNYDRVMEFCSLLSRQGVLRMAFLPEQIDVAHRWVRSFSANALTLPL